ncbi:MAG: hypothetical protein IPK26_26995 [Planctomycetes bacterium]|nr:hypothetical protein [Planctomycetota bacterium]
MAQAQYQRSKKEEQEQAKAAERQRAADEVALFESYLDVLTSVHRDLVLDVDWVAEGSRVAADVPLPGTAHEAEARAALTAYAPSVLARLTGAARQRREQLEAAVREAKAKDGNPVPGCR